MLHINKNFLIGIGTGIVSFFIIIFGISLVHAQQQPAQHIKNTTSPSWTDQQKSAPIQGSSTVQQPQTPPTPWTAPQVTLAQPPILNKPTPSTGGRGQFVTVEGQNLGSTPGEIIFSNGKDQFSIKNEQYKEECRGLWWRPSYIFVKIPESFQKGTYTFKVKRPDGVLSNEVSISVTDTSGGASICGVLPDNGPVGSAIRISGIEFGAIKGKVVLGKEELQVQQSDWGVSTITFILTPLQQTQGKLRIITSQQVMSNPIPFSATRCTAQSCGIGDLCCSDGTCRQKGLCKDKPSLCSYGWSFYTGKLFALGEKCTDNTQCLSGVCGPAKTCVRGDKNQQDACHYDAECKDGLSCSAGICKKTLRDVGEVCSLSSECFSQKCVNGICGQGASQLGDSCVYSQECFSGNCYKNHCAQSARCLQVEKIEPSGNTIPRNAVFTVTFNQLIDPSTAQGKVMLDPGVKGKTEVRILGTGLKAQSQVVFRPSEQLSQQKKYHVIVDGDIKAAGSDNVLKKCVTVSSQGQTGAVSSQDCKDRAQTTCQKRDGLLFCSDDPTCGNDKLVCSKESSCKITDDCKLCVSCANENRCRVTPPPPPQCKNKTTCQRADGTFYCTSDSTCKQDHLVCKISTKCTFGDDCKLCKPCANDDRCRVDEKKECGTQSMCKRSDNSLYCSDDPTCGGPPQKLVCSQGLLCLDSDDCSQCSKCSNTSRCQQNQSKTCEQQGKLICQTSDGKVYCSDDKKCGSDDTIVCSLGTLCLSTDSCSLCNKCAQDIRCKDAKECPGKTACKKSDGSTYCSDDSTCGGSTTLSNESRCVSIDAPDEVLVDQDFTATVKVKNTGTKTWSTNAHKLGTQDPQDNRFWIPGKNRVDLTKEIKPQETAEFSFQAKGYALPMEGPFSWRMVEEKVEWFGEECHKKIKVKLPSNGATCNSNAICEQGETCSCADCKDKNECKTPPVSDTSWNNGQCDLSLPQTIFAGGTFTAQATLKNTGIKTWSKDTYSLRSENPYENTSWGVSKIPLSRDVKPQESVDIQINARAFSTNKELFSFQMVEDRPGYKEWFGERCRDRIQGQGLEKPTQVKVVPDSGSLKMTLTWNDTNSSEEGYEIQRRSGSGSFVTIQSKTQANVTNYIDTASLVGNTIYTYRVRAVRGVYVSDFSDEVQGTSYATPIGTALLDGFRVLVDGVAKNTDDFTCVTDSCATHTYSIKAYSNTPSGQVEINPTSVEWLPQNANILVPQVPSDKQQMSFEVSVKGVDISGGSITITVKGDQGRLVTQTLSVTNHPCANAWKYPADSSQSFYDMKLYYCAGNNTDATKNLPLLRSTPVQVQRSGFDEWFFPFSNNTNNDAFIIRVYQNPSWVSAMRWYQDPSQKIGVGGPGSSEHDGFAAVQDGAGVYISTVDMRQSPPQPLIIYMTVNSNASDQTRQVYNEIIKSPQFAASVLDLQGAETAKKVRTDTRRVFDLKDVAFILDSYAASQATKCGSGLLAACQLQYPDLQFGTYIRGQALSAWPLSWTTTLANALGKALPLDPGTGKTAFGCTVQQNGSYSECACSAPFKLDTCWNEVAQTFYKPSVEDAISDSKVHAYSYTFTKRTTPAGNDGYRVCTHLDFLSLTGQTDKKYCIIK